MSSRITEEIIARQPPETLGIIRANLAENAELKARIEALDGWRMVKLLVPAQQPTSPPRSPPAATTQIAAKTQWETKPRKTGTAVDPNQSVRRRAATQACRMPALQPTYESLTVELPTQSHLNINETATKEENGKTWLWTFLQHEGIKPTNNAGERCVTL
jgi:hypothetical protein